MHKLFFKSNIKRSAFVNLTFCPDKAVVIRDHFTGNRKTDAGAIVFGPTMKALKHLEDAFSILGFESDSIVSDLYKMIVFFFVCRGQLKRDVGTLNEAVADMNFR